MERARKKDIENERARQKERQYIKGFKKRERGRERKHTKGK